MNDDRLKEFLDSKVAEYNQPFFIKDDPVCIPHLFTKKQDIEIAGFSRLHLPGVHEKVLSTPASGFLN